MISKYFQKSLTLSVVTLISLSTVVADENSDYSEIEKSSKNRTIALLIDSHSSSYKENNSLIRSNYKASQKFRILQRHGRTALARKLILKD